MRKRSKGIVIFLLALGVILSAFTFDYTNTVGLIGLSALIISAVASLISLYIPTKFEKKFTSRDWKDGDSGDYFILVSGSAHVMGPSSTVTVYRRESKAYSEVMVATKIADNGDVLLGANIRFDGKVVIN